jgi:uncharacterized protein YcbK (DUF882 family)
MKISQYFSLSEFTRSQTAARQYIDNTPSEIAIENIKKLATQVLDPLREAIGKPITVSSGYRSPRLNKAVGGAENSDHMRGLSADIIIAGVHPSDVCKTALNLGLPMKNIINEYGKWTHITLGEEGQKTIAMTAEKQNGKTHYIQGIA